jgi:hypothetical protein
MHYSAHNSYRCVSQPDRTVTPTPDFDGRSIVIHMLHGFKKATGRTTITAFDV